METKHIALALAAAFFASGLFCSGPSSPSPSGNCEEEPATDPASVNSGELPLTLGTAYVEETKIEPDASSDLSSHRYPRYEYDTIFEPFDADNPTLQVVNGFQGGSHLEPAIAIPKDHYDSLDATIRFQLRKPGNGKVMTTRSCDQPAEERWAESGDRIVYNNLRLVLDVKPARVEGKEMELIADVEVNGDRKVLKQVVTILASE